MHVTDRPAAAGTRAAGSTPPTTGRDAARLGGWARIRAGLLTGWAAVTGAAPHVLHHAGPLAGTALVAGAGGRVLFGMAGFVATVPMLRRLRRRTGGWRAPMLALTAFALVFTLSSVVIGPALTTAPETGEQQGPGRDAEVDHHGHDPAEGAS